MIDVHRYSIAGLMTTVLYLGMCFAALRSKNPEVGRSVVYNLTIALIAFTILAAFARRDRYRSTLAGAACFGCVYLFLELSHFVVELQTRSGTVVNCLLAILAGLIGAAWGLLFVRGQPAATAAPALAGDAHCALSASPFLPLPISLRRLMSSSRGLRGDPGQLLNICSNVSGHYIEIIFTRITWSQRHFLFAATWFSPSSWELSAF